MSAPDFTTIPGITLDGGEPVFDEPWQAQAFAMTVSLHEKSVFTWSEWAEAFSAELASADNDAGYYNCWLAALEKLLSTKGMTSPDAIAQREQQWHEAAAKTPHGGPITLSKS